MDTPTNNPQGYELGSILHYASQFPDDDNRLVIVHGLMDENVHFTHTAAIIDALVQTNKPYVLKVFPEERHGIRNFRSALYFEQFFIRFLLQNL